MLLFGSVGSIGKGAAEEPFGLMNPGFEEILPDGGGGWTSPSAVGWSLWTPVGNPSATVSDSVYRTGGHALQISSPENGRAAVSQDIAIEGGNHYKLSAWLKTADVTSTQGARLRVVYYSGDQQINLIYSDKLRGTNDWTRIEKALDPPKEIDRIRVQLFLEEGTGTVWFDDVSLVKTNPIEAIEIEEEQITVEQEKSAPLTWSFTPEDALETGIRWESSDPSVATVQDGIVTGVREGKATITVKTKEGLSDYCVVTVTQNPEHPPVAIESITLSPETATLDEHRYTLLNADVQPKNADTDSLQWTSSNEQVAIVEKGGLIKALSPGKATITVQSKDGSVQAQSTVTVREYEKDEYDQLRERWEEQLLGTSSFDENNPRMTEMMKKRTEKAERLWVTMYKNEDHVFMERFS